MMYPEDNIRFYCDKDKEVETTTYIIKALSVQDKAFMILSTYI